MRYQHLRKTPDSDQLLRKDGNHSKSLPVLIDISIQFVLLCFQTALLCVLRITDTQFLT